MFGSALWLEILLSTKKCLGSALTVPRCCGSVPHKLHVCVWLQIAAGVLLALLCSAYASAAQETSLFGGRKLGRISPSRSLAETVTSYAVNPSLAVYYGPYGGYGMAGYGFSYGASSYGASAYGANSYGAGAYGTRLRAPAPAPAPGPMPDMANFPLPAPTPFL